MSNAAKFPFKLAEQILKSKATDFDPSQFADRYEETVIELLEKKQASIAVFRERTTPQPLNLVNIVDALRQRLQREKHHPLRRRRRASGLRDRARCCFP